MSEVINQTEPVVVIHHNDRDGILSATCVSEYIRFLYDEEPPTIKYISANYTKSIQEMIEDLDLDTDIEQLWIVDYSITRDDNAEYVLKLSDRVPVYWIDHHKASITYCNTNSDYGFNLRAIHGFRVDGIAACALTYIYTHYLMFKNNNYGVSRHDYLNKSLCSLSENSKEIAAYRLLEEISDTDTIVSPETALTLLESLNVPKLIIYAHRYDTFDLNDYVLYFSYGETNIDPEYPVLEIRDARSVEYVNKCIEKGKIIKDYLDKTNKEHIKDYAFECTVKVVDSSTRGKRDINTYTAIALNTMNMTSLTFGDLIKDYDICIAFHYTNDRRIRASFYTNKNYVDCSLLCTLLGGGGHAKAAGFTVPEDMFTILTDYKTLEIVIV